jgi:hypothetical protein
MFDVDLRGGYLSRGTILPMGLRTGFVCITHRESHLGSMFGSSECGDGADVASWSKNDYRSHLLRRFCLVAV